MATVMPEIFYCEELHFGPFEIEFSLPDAESEAK